MLDYVKLRISFACLRYLWTRVLLAIQNGLIEQIDGYELIEEILHKMPDIEKESIFALDKEEVEILIKRETLLAILVVSNFEDVDINRRLVGAELIIRAKEVLTKKESKYSLEDEEERLKRLFEGGEL
ncbi:MAG: hypothetical protein ACO2O4_04885 [Minisyncoccia bacterium]|jgi:hypothetical protein